MAPHSSTLAWKIPWTEEPGGLQSMVAKSRTRLKWLSSIRVSLPHREELFSSGRLYNRLASLNLVSCLASESPVNRDQVSVRPELITEAGASAQRVSVWNTKDSLTVAFHQPSCDQTGETVDQAWSKQRCNCRVPWALLWKDLWKHVWVILRTKKNRSTLKGSLQHIYRLKKWIVYPWMTYL